MVTTGSRDEIATWTKFASALDLIQPTRVTGPLSMSHLLEGKWDMGFVTIFGHSHTRIVQEFDFSGNAKLTLYYVAGQLFLDTGEVYVMTGTYLLGDGLCSLSSLHREFDNRRYS